ncbi:MAG: hypothetical protein MUF58_13485 [Arcicella sp.]|jgi:hypothetical protein|nr:hypothetical protein [Arcicella sp.]
MRNYIKGTIKGKCKLPNPDSFKKRSDVRINELRNISIYEAYISQAEEITGGYAHIKQDKQSFEPTYPLYDVPTQWIAGTKQQLSYHNIIIKEFKILNVLDVPESADRYADFEGVFYGTVTDRKKEETAKQSNAWGTQPSSAPTKSIFDNVLTGSGNSKSSSLRADWRLFWLGVLMALLLLWLLPHSCTRMVTNVPECVPDTIRIVQVQHDTIMIQDPVKSFISDSAQIVSNTPNISMMIGDHSVTDHDTISIYVNDVLLVERFEINKEEPKHFAIDLEEGDNTLRIETHSIGTEGNYASPLIIIEAGSRRYHLEPKCRPEKPFIYNIAYYK